MSREKTEGGLAAGSSADNGHDTDVARRSRRRILSGIATAVGFGFVGAGVHSDSVAATARLSGSNATGYIVIREAGCGSVTNSATVTCRPESSQVIVSGTISGSDSCQTAVIESVTYTPATETLDVVIATETKESTPEQCLMCVYEIDYEAFITLQEYTPTTVVVHHRGVDGDTVVTREPCDA